MKKKFLEIASSLEKFHKERHDILNDKYVSEQLAKEQIAEKENKFKQSAAENFQKVERKLDRQAEEARAKLEELQGGSYDRRQYEYTRAVNELNNYDDPLTYLQDKSESASNEIEMQEARKAVLSKARATDTATYEQVKENAVNTMSEEELKARKEIAETELQRHNLKSAKNRIDNNFYDEVSRQYNDPEIIKTELIAFSEVDNLDRKAEKKIADTI